MIRVTSPAETTISTHWLPDLTPLLDVLFILLVFFILSANPVFTELEVELPRVVNDAATAAEVERLKVVIPPGDAAGWTLAPYHYTEWSAFAEAIKQRHQAAPSVPVVVEADRAASAERLLRVLALLREAQIQTAHIGVVQEGAR